MTHVLTYVDIANTASEEVMSNVFYHLSQCECCPYHKGDSPISLNSDATTPKVPRMEGVRCTCDCRHKKRIIVRAHKYQQALIHNELFI